MRLDMQLELADGPTGIAAHGAGFHWRGGEGVGVGGVEVGLQQGRVGEVLRAERAAAHLRLGGGGEVVKVDPEYRLCQTNLFHLVVNRLHF